MIYRLLLFLTGDNALKNIHDLLSAAVKKRMMGVRRIGCLLSGGLDSSLITSLVVRHAKEMQLPYNIQTFSIGMDGSPDVIAARKVCGKNIQRSTENNFWDFVLSVIFIKEVTRCEQILRWFYFGSNTFRFIVIYNNVQ